MASNGAARLFTLVRWIVRIFCSVVAALIVVHAVFVLFEANPQNMLVEFTAWWRDVFGWFTKDLFAPSDPKIAGAGNGGLAALIWGAVGRPAPKLIGRFAPTPTKEKV